ncbi:MAG: crossover junction endodeoxyribonuclease RuvC [Patescibacteria group bacterium]
MIVLGLDPGLASTGFGLIEFKKKILKVINYGCILTQQRESPTQRLKKIYQGIKKIIKKYQPDLIVLEELFFAKNTKTAIKVGQARGVAILACSEAKCPIKEITPLQVKTSLTGYGRATKKQIQRIVKLRLKLKEIPKPDDAADALALAISGFKLFKKYEI